MSTDNVPGIQGVISFEIDDTKWAQLQALLGKNLSRALQKTGQAMAIQILQDIKTSLIPGASPHAPIDRGIFRASWKSRGALAYAGGGGYADTSVGLTIYSTAPHAPFIEYGVRAGNVKVGKKMIDALTEWALRKGLVDKKGLKAKANVLGTANAAKMIEEMAAQMFKHGVDAASKPNMKKLGATFKMHRNAFVAQTTKNLINSEARGTAFAIAHAMQKRGIFGDGMHILAKAIARIKPNIAVMVGKAVAEVFPP